MPLASAEAREKRAAFETALDALQSQNVNLSVVMRSLDKPAAQRQVEFKKFTGDSKDDGERYWTILRKHTTSGEPFRQQRDKLAAEKDTAKAKLTAANLAADTVEQQAPQWLKLNAEETAKENQGIFGQE